MFLKRRQFSTIWPPRLFFLEHEQFANLRQDTKHLPRSAEVHTQGLARRVPVGGTRWFNGLDPNDFVTLGRALTAETFAEGIENRTEIKNGEDAHAITAYLHLSRQPNDRRSFLINGWAATDVGHWWAACASHKEEGGSNEATNTRAAKLRRCRAAHEAVGGARAKMRSRSAFGGVTPFKKEQEAAAWLGSVTS
jgi:hypothetical protein